MTRFVTAVVTIVLAAIPTAPTANADPQRVYLPNPAGPYQPGTALLHLIDETRAEEFPKEEW